MPTGRTDEDARGHGREEEEGRAEEEERGDEVCHLLCVPVGLGGVVSLDERPVGGEGGADHEEEDGHVGPVVLAGGEGEEALRHLVDEAGESADLVEAEEGEGEDDREDDEELDEVADEGGLEAAEERVQDDDGTGSGNGPVEREAHADADDGADGEELEGVVEELHGESEPGEGLAHGWGVARGDEVDGAALCGAPQANGEEARAEEDGGDGEPADGDGYPAVLVGEGGVHHERERREAVHVEGYAGEPPWDGLVAPEERAGVLAAAREENAHADHRGEEDGDYSVVCDCESLACHGAYRISKRRDFSNRVYPSNPESGIISTFASRIGFCRGEESK